MKVYTNIGGSLADTKGSHNGDRTVLQRYFEHFRMSMVVVNACDARIKSYEREVRTGENYP